MIKTITILLATLALSTSGCGSQHAQKVQDEKFKHDIEEQKKKSNSMPVNGSKAWTHYIP